MLNTNDQSALARPNLLMKLLALVDPRTVTTFLTVGGLSALINFGSFALFWKVFHFYYQFAVTLSYVLSVIFHFIANRRFTFRAHRQALWPHLSKYLMMVAVNYPVTLLVVYVVVEIVHWPPPMGVACGIGVTVTTGYIMSKFWVFK